MDNTLKHHTLAGIVSTLAAAALFHFIYGWFHHHLLVGFFTPINNSIWEYLKLIFVPMTVFAIVEHQLIGKTYPRLMPARIYGMFGGIFVIILTISTFAGIFGRRFLLLDITAVVVGTVAAFLISNWIQLKYRLTRTACERSIIFLTAFAVCLVAFTIIHPKLALFIAYKPPAT